MNIDNHKMTVFKQIVVVDVHFAIDLALRSLRERLLIAPDWPLNTEAAGLIMGDEYL